MKQTGDGILFARSPRQIIAGEARGLEHGYLPGLLSIMRKKILIVEDNTELLEFLRLGLKQAGFTVVSAVNGVQALKKARSLKPDLIVLDLVLPEMDGFAVCEAVRKDDALQAVPVILLSGLTTEFSRFAGLEAGANEFVTKPISIAGLVSKIRHWVRPPTASESAQPCKCAFAQNPVLQPSQARTRLNLDTPCA